MVFTHTAIVNPPQRLLRDEALIWADAELAGRPHSELTLGVVAKACGKQPPSLHKAFGSHIGFLATLAAMQWERATAAAQGSGTTPMDLALGDIRFAIEHPHRFRLMYEGALWSIATDPAHQGPEREREGLEAMERYRDANYTLFEGVMQGRSEREVRLVAALLTGLSFEFVNERLFDGKHEEQLAHARELLAMVLS